MLQDGRILGEKENLTPGPVRHVHPAARRRRVRRLLPERQDRPVDVHRHRRRRGRPPARPTDAVADAGGRRRTAAYVQDRGRPAGAGDQGVHRRGQGRRHREGQGAVRAGPRATTRRSSRSPRASATSTPRSTPGSTTSPTRRQWTGFHRIEKALWAGQAPGRHDAGRRQAGRRRRQAAVKLIPTAELPAGADRQRRRRPARRGRQQQDHRRGGPLQPHRPVRLRGQHRRRPRGVRRCSRRRCSQIDPALLATVDAQFADVARRAVDVQDAPTATSTTRR